MLRLVFISWLVFAALFSKAQQVPFRHFDREAGGPEYVYDLVQGEDGILYVASGERVFAFNGHTFDELFRIKDGSGVIARIHVAPSGELWMASRAGGPFVLKNQKIRQVTSPEISVTGFAQQGSVVLFATREHGIWRCDSTFKATQFYKSEIAVNDITTDKNGNTLAATDEGLVVLAPDGTFYTAAKNIHLGAISAGEEHSFWCTGREGIYRFEIQNKRYTCTLSPARQPALAVPGALCIVADNKTLWVGMPQGCIRVRIPSGRDTLFRIQTLDATAGLTNSQVQALLKDRENNIWFGSFGSGLFQKPVIRFVQHGMPPGTEESGINSIITGGDSVVFAGNAHGLWRYTRRNGRWKAVDTTHRPVTALAFDHQNTLWAGTTRGVFTLDKHVQQLKQVPGTERFGSLQVNHLSTGNNRIFIGTSSGMFVYHRKNKIELLRTDEGLLHNNVRHVFQDSKGRIWVASHGTPPYYIHNGKVTAFKSIEGLESFKINATAEDSVGNIWIATDGDGIFRFDGNIFRNYGVAQGLVSGYCSAVVAGGHVWVGHRSGLSDMAPGADYFTGYGKVQGLTAGLSRMPMHIDATSALWMGTKDGLVFYAPKKRVPPLQATNIIAVEIDDRYHHPDSAIVKKFGHYTVRIKFLSVSLANPASVSYRYRLAGADTNWQTTTQRQVIFPQLADGSYTFEVQGMKDGEPLAADTVVITIREPIWRQAWFYLLLLALVASVTYAYVIIRTRAYRRRQMLLELKVQRKTFLLQREKDAVEAIRLVLEERNKDITDSIQYAKKIQDSILPPDIQLRSLFGDNYFVFYKPKDIVSGDLYWASILAPEQANKYPLALASVVDCTGHGVPGAFLSIMANDFLRQSIMEPGINMPHEVLDFLNEKISSHLNQTAGARIRDGMDLALVGIDYKNKILHFSGANNPIYIYRKQYDSIDQIILTATKQPIGMISETTVKFASRAFRLMPGDTIYLFSDGYADQFGGEHNKKLTYKRFREILESACELPIRDQKDYLSARFEEWKNNQPQTDDVCVMGIRIP